MMPLSDSVKSFVWNFEFGVLEFIWDLAFGAGDFLDFFLACQFILIIRDEAIKPNIEKGLCA
jgi:hypothetical protein